MSEFLDSAILKKSFDIGFIQTNARRSNKNKGKLGILVLGFNVYYFIRLLYGLSFKKYQLIYYPITATELGWVGRDAFTIILARIFRKKVVIHLRASHFALNYSQFTLLSKHLVGYALGKVHTCIVQAEYLKHQFVPFMDQRKIQVLYQSINTNKFTLKSRKDVITNKILIVGHLTQAKGYIDIVKAIPLVAKKFPDVKFYFAGEMRSGESGVHFNQLTGTRLIYEDPYLAERSIKESHYSENYKHIGLISGEEKLFHFKSADIFLSASYSEGFSRSVAEAMSVGTPVVITRVGAHREVFSERNGRLIDPGNIQAIANSVIEILSDESRTSIGLYNRDMMVSNFAVEKICLRFKDILLQTLDGKY